MTIVNINTASETELARIKHIGKARAKKIIEARPFKDIFELSNVKGLGAVRMWQIFKQNIIQT